MNGKGTLVRVWLGVGDRLAQTAQKRVARVALFVHLSNSRLVRLLSYNFLKL
jgi:hypothetical protein